jgi:hypothetical protein
VRIDGVDASDAGRVAAGFDPPAAAAAVSRAASPLPHAAANIEMEMTPASRRFMNPSYEGPPARNQLRGRVGRRGYLPR